MTIGRQEIRHQMRQPTVLYHSDHPEGVFFDAATEDLSNKASEGWADNPAKLNIFPNSGIRKGETHPVRAAVERGEEPMIDLHSTGRGSSVSTADIERMEAEIRRLNAALEMQSGEQVSAEQQRKRELEEHADETLTAARAVGGIGGNPLPNQVIRNLQGESVVQGHNIPSPESEEAPDAPEAAANGIDESSDESEPAEEDEAPVKTKPKSRKPKAQSQVKAAPEKEKEPVEEPESPVDEEADDDI